MREGICKRNSSSQAKNANGTNEGPHEFLLHVAVGMQGGSGSLRTSNAQSEQRLPHSDCISRRECCNGVQLMQSHGRARLKLHSVNMTVIKAVPDRIIRQTLNRVSLLRLVPARVIPLQERGGTMCTMQPGKTEQASRSCASNLVRPSPTEAKKNRRPDGVETNYS